MVALASVTGVDFAQDNLLTLSYPERQLIVVDDDAAVEVVRPAASGDAVRRRALDGPSRRYVLAAPAPSLAWLVSPLAAPSLPQP